MKLKSIKNNFYMNYIGGVTIIKCIECHEKLSYIELIFTIWKINGYVEIQCKNCYTTLKVNRLSRLIIAILMSLPILLQKYIFKFDINVIVFYLIYILILIVISPLIVSYDKIN